MDETTTVELKLSQEGTPKQRERFAAWVCLSRFEYPDPRQVAVEYEDLGRAMVDDSAFITPDQHAYVAHILRRRLGLPPAGDLPPIAAATAPRSLRTGRVLQAPPRRNWSTSRESRNRRKERLAWDFLPLELRTDQIYAYIVTLNVVLLEIAKHGRCKLHKHTIGAFGGYRLTSVRNAIRKAEQAGPSGEPALLQSQRRRRRGHLKNDANVVTITCPKLQAHIRLKVLRMRGISRAGRAYWGLPPLAKVFNFLEPTGPSEQKNSGDALAGDNIPSRTPPKAASGAAEGSAREPDQLDPYLSRQAEPVSAHNPARAA